MIPEADANRDERSMGYVELAAVAMHALSLPATEAHPGRPNKKTSRIVAACGARLGVRVGPESKLARLVLSRCPDARVFIIRGQNIVAGPATESVDAAAAATRSCQDS